MFEQVRVVLVNPTHPGNIGAVARAMKNMGLDRLVLVAPERFPSADATARASGADDVLATAALCSDLDSALQGCRLVFGATARARSSAWPIVEPRAGAQQLIVEASTGSVAVVFGREHSGLSNAELDRCHALVRIPCNPSFASLNLAAAVQVITYEIRMAWLAQRPTPAVASPEVGCEVATVDALESFYAHLEQALVDLDFLDRQYPGKLMRKLRRLFNRARPEPAELDILRGILSAAQGRKSMRRESVSQKEQLLDKPMQ